MLKRTQSVWLIPMLVLAFGCSSGQNQEAAQADNPCAAAAADNPCAANPCAANPCAENPCNPCATDAGAEGADNPCAANPCATNPCATGEGT